MHRIFALAWAFAALVAGYFALSIALGPKGDASGWAMALVFAVASGSCVWQAWREWKPNEVPGFRPETSRQSPAPMPASDFPGAWRGDPVALEVQIDALKDAGLTLAAGRTIAELLMSWPRADYEADPYNLILFMYGSDVEAEPWGRAFCERGWNFDMECLEEAGDYARAFARIARATGAPELATNMSDNFRFDAESCEIRYTINGRERVLNAKVDSDWADPEAVGAFVRDIEATIGDGRHFWACDNGQASILFFLTGTEASKINALRDNVLTRYITA